MNQDQPNDGQTGAGNPTATTPPVGTTTDSGMASDPAVTSPAPMPEATTTGQATGVETAGESADQPVPAAGAGATDATGAAAPGGSAEQPAGSADADTQNTGGPTMPVAEPTASSTSGTDTGMGQGGDDTSGGSTPPTASTA